MKTQAIYRITNIITNKFYIGSAVFVQSRFRQHKYELRKNKHGNKLLQYAWNKYGEESFIFDVIEKVEHKDKLIEREQYWIDFTRCYKRGIGYNIRTKAESQLGLKRSLESIEKSRQARIGKKQTKEHIESRVIHYRGKSRSDEVRAKISAGHKNKKLSEEHRKNLGIAQKKRFARERAQTYPIMSIKID